MSLGLRSLFGVVLAAGLLAAAWVFGDHADEPSPSRRMADGYSERASGLIQRDGRRPHVCLCGASPAG